MESLEGLWGLQKLPVSLASYASTTCWPPGEALKTDILPSKDRVRGIHAWKNMDDLLKYFYILSITHHRYLVIGQVALWGEVIEQKLGYRAQYAYPYKLEFLITARNDSKSKYKYIENTLRNNYGCEVNDFHYTGNKEYNDGTKITFENGVPSYQLKYNTGLIEYITNGFWHNEDGPARIHMDGTKEYYRNGSHIKSEFPPEEDDIICEIDSPYWKASNHPNYFLESS